MTKESLIKKLKLLRREEPGKASVAEAIDVLIEAVEFLMNDQPERSKREDSFFCKHCKKYQPAEESLGLMCIQCRGN